MRPQNLALNVFLLSFFCNAVNASTATATATPRPKPSRSIFGRRENDLNIEKLIREQDNQESGAGEDEISRKEESVETVITELPQDEDKTLPSIVADDNNGRFGFFNKRRANAEQGSTEEVEPHLEPDAEVEKEAPSDFEDESTDQEISALTDDDVPAPSDQKDGVNRFGFFNRKINSKSVSDSNEDTTTSDDENIKDQAVTEDIEVEAIIDVESNSGNNSDAQPEKEIEGYDDTDEADGIKEGGKTEATVIANMNTTDTKEVPEKTSKEVSSFAQELEELLEDINKDAQSKNATQHQDRSTEGKTRETRDKFKKGKKRKVGLGRAVHNAFPWLKKEEKEAKAFTGGEEESSEREEVKAQTNTSEREEVKAQTNTTNTSSEITAQPVDPVAPIGKAQTNTNTGSEITAQPVAPVAPIGPFGSSPPPFIIFPPSPPGMSRPLPSLPMRPRKTLQSPTDATVASLVNALLPLLSRLLLLTLLSGGSALFGSDDHIYSPEPTQHFMLERVNQRYLKDSMAMKKALESPPEDISKRRWSFTLNKRKSALKKIIEREKKTAGKTSEEKPWSYFSRTVIIMDVQTLHTDMDIVVERLRDSVSFILAQYNDKKKRLDMGEQLEIVVCVESPGGVVQDFGLAADQLNRLKEAGLTRNDLILTVCVDKIAASGGYMMACQASPGQLIAAPFSMLGSIGVLRETINVHDVLEKYGVRPLLLKAGSSKVPLTQTTKVTEESIAIVQKNLDSVHKHFREMVSDARGECITEFEIVTNGDIFLGKDAAKYGLVDRLLTSDEYVAEKIQAGDRVLRLHKYDRSRVGLRLSPLDFLLLKSDGLLGKNLTSVLRNSIKILSQVMRVGVTMGMMKVLDTAGFLPTLQRPENNI